MSVLHLDSLLHPRTVAVVGASKRDTSIGYVVLKNIIAGGFPGPIYPVNPHEKSILGHEAWNSIASLPASPDLAVICTPPATILTVIDELGRRGTRATIVLTAGLSRQRHESGRSIQDLMVERARTYGMRLLGPNCVGLLSASRKLNASFAHIDILPGKIAFVAQSGALCASVLDWARANDVGFSHVVSVGDQADIDFGDMLDYLGSDPETTAILLYIESIGMNRAREFMSAARGAARNKPVIAVKAGRNPEGQRAALSHTGALAGSDMVYDAALRRAGILRVFEIGELFDAAQTLARTKPFRGPRLAIITNGGGPGVLATDALAERGGTFANLSTATIERLDKLLPITWSRGNPIDMIGDAPAERYADAIRLATADPGVDALLVLHVPTALVSTDDAARAVAQASRVCPLPMLSCWLGQSNADGGRQILRDAGIATFSTPEDAVRAFTHLVSFHHNQKALMQVPTSAPVEFSPDVVGVRQLIKDRLGSGIHVLGEADAKFLLSAYSIPVVETVVVRSDDEAATAAGRFGYPVALKIVSSQITHKSDVGGVALNIQSEQGLRAAIGEMRERVGKLRPDATVDGFAVQQMFRRPGAHELIVGASVDTIFGPTILFGHGGTGVEVIGDRAVGLPPLNIDLAGDLISRTRISRLLAGYRDRPPADLHAIAKALVCISQLVIDHPEIAELDVNPLLADEKGIIALDARVRISPAANPDRLAIRPYPRELEEMVSLRDGRQVFVRPIRPEDQAAHERFIASLSEDDLHSRFFASIRKLEPSQMARLTQIDYDREMAFIAIANGDRSGETIGVVRAVADPDNQRAEMAVVVRSDMKARGLGFALMQKIIRYCQARGTGELVGETLSSNQPMLTLAAELGFEATTDPEAGTTLLCKNLRKAK